MLNDVDSWKFNDTVIYNDYIRFTYFDKYTLLEISFPKINLDNWWVDITDILSHYRRCICKLYQQQISI